MEREKVYGKILDRLKALVKKRAHFNNRRARCVERRELFSLPRPRPREEEEEEEEELWWMSSSSRKRGGG